MAVLGVLAVLLLACLAIIVSVSGAQVREARAAMLSNTMTDHLLSAAGLWAQERGLTNLTLHAPTPALPATIVRIHRLRDQADNAYSRAQDVLRSARLRADPDRQQAFDASFKRLQVLRAQADRQFTLPAPQRDPALTEGWFPAISDVIVQSQLTALHYSSQTLNAATLIGKDAMTRHNLWLMSEYAGRERGLMAGIIAAGRPITRDEMNALAEDRAYVQEGWRVISHLDMRTDETAALGPAMARVQNDFFGAYDALRTRLQAEGMAGRPYSLSAEAWFEQSTAAIDCILALEKAQTAYVDQRLETGQRDQQHLLWLCVLFAFSGAGAVGIAFWMVNRHVLNAVANLDAIFRTASDGLMTIDAAGIIRSFNPACERIFQLPARHAVGQPARDLMAEDERDAFDDEVKRHLSSQDDDAAGREVTGQRRTGALFPMHLSIRRFDLANRRHLCGVVRDITAAKLAERDRETLLSKLIESNTELERFAYVASHDMQEPIRMVMSFSQIIVQDYGQHLDDRGREYLEVLSESAHRMLTMVRDLLAYARLSGESAAMTEIDMDTQMAEIKTNLTELIQESGAVIEAAPLPQVTGNPVQIQRVMQNLITNAIKYQPDGQSPHVRIYAEDEGNHWAFHVQDNGLGIDTAYFQQIFEPFRRLHGPDRIKGSGFGLSIVKKIIANHGGEVRVTSTPGEGSRFSFTLPKT